jgi:L-malate glycosyltransferase
MSKTVIIAIPVLLVGGTEMQTLNLVNVLVGTGYHVTVCCYYEYDDYMVSRFKATGAQVLLMKYERSSGLVHLAKGLIGLFNTEKPYVVHVQYVAPGFVPVIAARIAGVKMVFATVHQPGSAYGWKAKLILRTAAQLCEAFFCVSKSAEESWFGNSELYDTEMPDKKRKHFTIYNAVDVSGIEAITNGIDKQSLKKTLGIIGNPVIGVVGRLRWEKGQDILLDAMREVIKAIPDAVLLIVGDGPDRQKLQTNAKKLGIEGHIIWMGQVRYDEVVKYYTIMDVVTVPSRFEGFGLSAAEAMAAGVPVIASAVDGLMEVIENGVNGYFVPVDNSKRLAITLINVLGNKQKSVDIVKKGKEHIKINFSIEKFTSSTISAYQHFYK